MAAPRYSVIVPYFNAAEHLSGCLDSVLAQSDGDWECLCVDDGSGDDGPGIVRGFAARDPRFRFFSLAHRGVGAARNLALESAAGEYLVYLDADDRLEPEALAGLRGETADLVTFLPMKRRPAGRAEMAPGEEGLYFDSLVGNLLAWNSIYRRETLGALRFPELGNYEDLVYSTAAFARARSVTAGVREWYCHRRVEGSAANSHSWRRVRDAFRSLTMIAAAARPSLAHRGVLLPLLRKLVMHLVLHGLMEIPRAMRHG